MNFDATVIAALIGISGILIAAIVSSVGYSYKSWTEHKRSTRKVLYLFLELRHAIVSSLFDPKEATEEYISHYAKRLKNKGIEVDRKDMVSQLKDLVQGHFVNLISAIKIDIEAKLLTPFENALLEMATVNPVLAYQIRGKEKIEKLITHTNAYQQNVKNDLIDQIEQKWLKDVFEETTIELKNESLNELATTLDNEVLSLAKGCGWLDHRKCKKAIAKGINYDNRYNFEELDVFIDKFVEKIIKAANHKMKADE